MKKGNTLTKDRRTPAAGTERHLKGGTALELRDIKEGKVLTTEDVFNAIYTWDAGIAIGRYLEELKKGRLVGKACQECRRILVPPRMFCELCFRPTDEWVTLQDTGTVNTFSLCYVNWDASRRKEPELPAVIEIDGASKGMGILHLLGEVDPQKVHIGMRVKAVWKPARDRRGAITDIQYWKPLED